MEQTQRDHSAREGVSRRGFLGGVAAAASAAVVPAALRDAAAAQAGKSRVVLINSEQLVAKYKDDPTSIRPMVEQMMCALTGEKKAQDAWASLFKPDQRVGIKVNCLFPPVTTTPPLADYVAQCLVQAGLKPSNIIVWDRDDSGMRRAGFTIAKDPQAVRCMGTESRFRRNQATERYSDKMKAGPVDTWLSRIVTDEIDALINMPVLKHHSIAGITASMKNHLGTVPNPNALHRDNCLYLADLSMLEPIRTKTRLILLDATKAQYDRGPGHSPQFVWPYSGLMASLDSVAIDRVAAMEIKAKRNASGRPGEIRPRPRHIDRAAELGLGQGDPGKIEVVRLTA